MATSYLVDFSKEQVFTKIERSAVYAGWTREQVWEQYDCHLCYPNQDRAPIEAKMTQEINDWKVDAESECSAIHLDVPYGESEKEKLDVYVAKSENAPIWVFIHGGYWQSRDKAGFSFVCRNFVKNGCTAVLLNYDLCPDVTIAKIQSQCRNALGWIYNHAKDYNSNPERIHICGHSAGGHLVVSCAETNFPELGEDLPNNLVKSCVSISGVFDLEPIIHTPLNNKTGMDLQQALEVSPMRSKPITNCPVTACFGALEREEFERQSTELARNWNDHGGFVRSLKLEGLHHMTALFQLLDQDSKLFKTAMGYINDEEYKVEALPKQDIVYKDWTSSQVWGQYHCSLCYPNQDQEPIDAVAVKNQNEWKEQCEAQCAAVHLDVPYGDSEREKIDIFVSEAENAPCWVFIHGGYWQWCVKSQTNHYARNFISEGVTCFMIEYDLCPDVTIKQIQNQCARALSWIYKHAKDYGADPNRIHIAGHSAGGHLVASMVQTKFAEIDPDVAADLVKSCVAISGPYDLEPIIHTPLNDATKLTLEQAVEVSPARGKPATNCPVTAVFGALEREEFRRQSNELADIWNKAGGNVTSVGLEGDHHATAASQLLDKDSFVFTTAIGYIKNEQNRVIASY